MSGVNRKILRDFVRGAADETTAAEVMVILEEVFATVESGTVPRTKFSIVDANNPAATDRDFERELTRLRAFEALQHASDLRVRGVIAVDPETLTENLEYRSGDPYEHSLVAIGRKGGGDQAALRQAISQSIGSALFGAVMNSPRAMEDSGRIFNYARDVIHAFLVFALMGEHECMARLAPLLHLLPRAVPCGRTADGQIVIRLGETIPAEMAEPDAIATAAAEPTATEPADVSDDVLDDIEIIVGDPIDPVQLGDMLVAFMDEVRDDNAGSQPLAANAFK